MAHATFRDVLDAFEFVSAGPPSEHEAYLSRSTGAIYWHSEHGDNFDQLPGDIDDTEKYVSIPHKRDLGLGKRLAIKFVDEFSESDAERVREIFSHRGAYAQFKNLLEVLRGLLDRWYEYEAAAEKGALLKWCKARESN